MNTHARVNVNLATAEDLAQVPRLGPALAARLIAARPFASLDDLQRVTGIGARSLARLRPYLEVTAPGVAANLGEEMAAEAGEESAFEASRAQPRPTQAEEAIPSAAEVPPTMADQMVEMDGTSQAAAPKLLSHPTAPKAVGSTQKVQPQWEGLLYSVGIGLLVLVLAVAFTLGLLGIINGGLAYPTASQFEGLQSQVGALHVQIEGVQQDVNSLRARLDGMEALSGRVGSVEREAQALRSELGASAARLDQLQAQVETLDEKMNDLEQRSGVFERFLDGLRALLGNLDAQPTPEEVPW